MVTVYVWSFEGVTVAWGHASLLIAANGGLGSVYVSYWPQGSGRDAKKESGSKQNVYSAPPIPNRTFDDDRRGEGKEPDFTFVLNGLDEAKMRSWWNGIVNDHEARWKTLSNNCSTTVANALKEGGADQYASMWSRHNIVWMPHNVAVYAQSIQEGLASASSK